MKEVGNVFEIKFERYGKKWVGYILDKRQLLAAEDCTDDDWELLEEYKDYDWVVEINGKPIDYPMIVNWRDIKLEAVKCDALFSGWGYVSPEAGAGLEDCGKPEIYFIDSDGEHRYLA